MLFKSIFVLLLILASSIGNATETAVSGATIDSGRRPASIGENIHSDMASEYTDAEMRHMQRQQQVYSEIRKLNGNKNSNGYLPKAETFRVNQR